MCVYYFRMVLSITLPSGCTWKQMASNVNLLKIHSPDTLDNGMECLTYLSDGNCEYM